MSEVDVMMGLIERLKSGIWLRRYPQDAPDHLYPSDEPLEAAAALTSISAERDRQREHIRKQAEDIMTLGKLVYASENETWKDQATSLRRKLEEHRETLEPFAKFSDHKTSYVELPVRWCEEAARVLSERQEDANG